MVQKNQLTNKNRDKKINLVVHFLCVFNTYQYKF
jgi:hypothetical protein